MTKMDKIWIAVAKLLHPTTASSATVTRDEIEAEVSQLFGDALSRVMIDRHLVSFEDRQVDKNNPSRGGSRNRYLFRTCDGRLPSRDGRFRLYKAVDRAHDGDGKDGPVHPDVDNISGDYKYLVSWYLRHYLEDA